MPHEVEPQKPNVGDHRAPGQASWLDSLPLRTLAQNAGVDLAIAVSLVVHDAAANSAHGIDWRLLAASLVKTVLVTVASSIMRQARPPKQPLASP